VTDTQRSAGGGIGLGGALFLVFVVLRLTDHIDWAWYWVASPLWVPLAVVLVIAAVFWLIFTPIVFLVAYVADRFSRGSLK
jgi:hypothetical protein